MVDVGEFKASLPRLHSGVTGQLESYSEIALQNNNKKPIMQPGKMNPLVQDLLDNKKLLFKPYFVAYSLILKQIITEFKLYHF